MRWASLCILSAHASALLLSISAQEATPLELEVRALANAGFLLSVGDDVVAVDAFVAEPYSGYGALSGEAQDALLAGSGPFASLDLALASHAHRDHFQPEPARRLLAARPACVFASSPQVLEALLADASGAAALEPAERLRDVLPEPGASASLEVGAIEVEFLRLSHGTGRFAEIQNLGHLITLGGLTALHVGDADMQPETFAAYRLRERGLDVVFVPYWYFDSENGRRIVDEHFRPARLIACHIPPGELEAVTKRLAASRPEVLVPQRALELFRFRDAAQR
jgi:L-ascorbate metabolism protein UlaG (beta-lactamase superfamily)